MRYTIVILFLIATMTSVFQRIDAEEKTVLDNNENTKNEPVASVDVWHVSPQLIHAVKPVFPDKARSLRTGGFVLVEFTVTVAGTVTDVVVLNSKPQGMFEEEAIRAMQQFLYKPVKIEGNIVPYRYRLMLRFDSHNISGPGR